MQNVEIESHPFKPFLFPEAKLVMCGSFPPKKEKWGMEFYYPNFQNDMWRVYGLILFDDKDYFVNDKKKGMDKYKLIEALRKNGIALTGTAREVIREKGNASDKHLKIVKKIDLPSTFSQLPECNDLATTGEKAAAVIAELTATNIPKVGEYVECEITMPDGSLRHFRHWRMPSTSRAYPMKLEDKANYYRKMLRKVLGC